ncbi:hypothetical protein EOA32_00810 [Mesorhizobium sp. M1A.F.Ca.ET.072.01.1.1]|uniref:hypothetical protein n=1 Tax=Mesorhizobium sp. M1A.F.Ca.ET.072.01.1.1 TaxID=2496753 RepID=UPI000FD1D5C3|nr:hypothetical protein [Mesorhizobium sp. M1A.F.Ca.ET.072.01.1.1]RUW55592.1 hypothetical protein EOA32_00810 [Mesorhizobium sp. M1A.F.Ca.ET.072.01.1.1]
MFYYFVAVKADGTTVRATFATDDDAEHAFKAATKDFSVVFAQYGEEFSKNQPYDRFAREI